MELSRGFPPRPSPLADWLRDRVGDLARWALNRIDDFRLWRRDRLPGWLARTF